MTDHMTNSEALHHQLARELGGFKQDVHIEALSNDEAKAITDATIVDSDTDDVDPIETAMSNAVNTPSIGSMPNLGLNWGTDGDAALTEYFNRGI